MKVVYSLFAIFVCAVLLIPEARGQEVDSLSLQDIYEQTNNTDPLTRFPAVLKLIKYHATEFPDSVDHYVADVADALPNLQDVDAKAAIYDEVFKLAQIGELERTTRLELLMAVAGYAEGEEDYYLLLRVHRYLSQFYYHASQFDKALAFQFQAMEDSRRPGMPAHTRIFPYVSLAHIYGNRPAGRLYADTANVLIKETGPFPPKALHWLYTHLGTYYQRIGLSSVALNNFEKARTVIEENDNITIDPYLLLEFGKAYQGQQKFEKAHSYFLQAQAVCERRGENMLDIKIDIAKALVELARKTNQLDLAEEYATQIIDEASTSGYLQPLALAHRTLHDLFTARGMTDRAAMHSAQYFVLKDSLDVLEKANIDYFRARALELTIKDNEMHIVEAKVELQTMRMITLTIVLIFASIMLVFFFLSRREQTIHNNALSAKNKQIEDSNEALRTINEQLTEAKKKAEESDKLKSSILENMSHEFRTPLTSIIGYAEMLGDQEEGNKPLVAHIQRGGRRLLNTLTALMDFAQLEGGDNIINYQSFDFLEVVNKSLSLFKPLAQSKGISLNLAPAQFNHLQVNADYTAIERILSHLINNAIDFTDEGEVCVRVMCRQKDLIMQVEDSGVGMSPAFIDQAFAPFRQESTGHARTHEGIGLGLSITKHLIELMDGQIEVESVAGEGTSVTVMLPVVIQD